MTRQTKQVETPKSLKQNNQASHSMQRRSSNNSKTKNSRHPASVQKSLSNAVQKAQNNISRKGVQKPQKNNTPSNKYQIQQREQQAQRLQRQQNRQQAQQTKKMNVQVNGTTQHRKSQISENQQEIEISNKKTTPKQRRQIKAKAKCNDLQEESEQSQSDFKPELEDLNSASSSEVSEEVEGEAEEGEEEIVEEEDKPLVNKKSNTQKKRDSKSTNYKSNDKQSIQKKGQKESIKQAKEELELELEQEQEQSQVVKTEDTLAKSENDESKQKSPDKKKKSGGGSNREWYDKPLERWQEISKFIDDNLEDNYRPTRITNIPSVQPHPNILMQLLPFQYEFLSWAVNQEKMASLRGGILADEMGMGKTIQAISLIMTHYDDDLDPSQALHDDSRRLAYLQKQEEAQIPPLKLKLNQTNLTEGNKNAIIESNLNRMGNQTGHSILENKSSPQKENNIQPTVGQQGNVQIVSDQDTKLRKDTVNTVKQETKKQDESKQVIDKNEHQENGIKMEVSGSEMNAEESGGGSQSQDQSKQNDTGFKSAREQLMDLVEEQGGKGGSKKSKLGNYSREEQEQIIQKMIQEAHELHDYPVEQDDNYCKTTLVVCPVVAIYQWSQEIQKYTVPGSLKVAIYQGNMRDKLTVQQLKSADVVLTNYNTLEADFRKIMPTKITCKYCHKKYLPEKLNMHLRFFCGPYAMKSDAQARQQRGGGHSYMAMQRAMKEANEHQNRVQNQSDSDNEEDTDLKKGKAVKGSAQKKGKGAKKGKAKQGTSGKKEEQGTSVGGKRLRSGQGLQSTSKKGGSAKKGKGQQSNKKQKTSKGKGGKADLSDSEFTIGSSEDEASASESESEQEYHVRRNGKGSGRQVKESDIDNDNYDEDSYDSEDSDSMDEEDMQRQIDDELKGRTRDEWVADEVKQMIDDEKKYGSGKDRYKSILHEIKWRRVILDEAHSVKDRQSNTAKAVFKLRSKYKWALSGTPLQNRVNELYSQIRFLRVYPYAYFFCSNGNCPKSCHLLDLTFVKEWHRCDDCQCSRMMHYSWWNRNVANPIKYHGFEGRGKAAMLLLKHEILEKVLMRRTKLECADDLFLPPRQVIMRKDRMDEKEHDFYEALYTQSQAHFGSFVQAGTLVNNYAHIFDLLIRLRQAVDHPYLVQFNAQKMKREAEKKQLGEGPSFTQNQVQNKQLAENGNNEQENNEEDEQEICDICHDQSEDKVVTDCGHYFCRQCLMEYIAGATQQANCPTCSKLLTVDFNQKAPENKNNSRKPSVEKENTTAITQGKKRGKGVKAKYNKNSIINRIPDLTQFISSTKIENLWEEVHKMKAEDPTAKAIVFSQYTSMLDIIQYRLEQVGINCTKLDGSMKREHRDEVIEKFTYDPNICVFLMSLKAGGVALNLTAASHVMIMDPWWNPAVEQQAQDRIHRLGQYKPIKVIRFISAGTIEERILKLQEKKKLIFETTVGKDRENVGSLSVADLKFLFG